MENDILALEQSGDVLFMMLGAAMVFAMHGGFAFLEVGTVRKKNQVNALVKIIVDFAISTSFISPSVMQLLTEFTFINRQMFWLATSRVTSWFISFFY
jgi:ammonia channel protein AmtB